MPCYQVLKNKNYVDLSLRRLTTQRLSQFTNIGQNLYLLWKNLSCILWLYFLADFGSYRDARDAEDSIAKLFSKLSFYPKEYVINKPLPDVVIKQDSKTHCNQ